MDNSSTASRDWPIMDAAVLNEPPHYRAEPEPDPSGPGATTVIHPCDGLGEGANPGHAVADWIVVSGCLEYGHINVRYYCDHHWETILQNAGNVKPRLTCWACRRAGRFGGRKTDDYIVEHV